MSWDSNIYYHPEKYGLEEVGEVDWDDEPYQFNITAVWRDENGDYYLASDSGCSCPAPFEDFNSLSDLEGPFSGHKAMALLTEYADHPDPEARARAAVTDIAARIMA